MLKCGDSMIGYKTPQYCDTATPNCDLDVCCYECDVEVCEYRCHLYDYKDYSLCKHADFSKTTLD